MEKLCQSGTCCFTIMLASANQEWGDGKKGEEASEENLQQLPIPIRRVVEGHKGVLELPNGLPPPRPFDHRIALRDETRPVYVPPYCYANFHKGEIERQVNEMLAQGLTQPSTSHFSSHVLLVRKNDGLWRFCIN